MSVTFEGQMGAETQEKCPKKKWHASSVCSYSKQRAAILPKGLVGAKITAQVTIAEKDGDCLLDTGSQVTTIPNLFYQQNLSHLPIYSNNLLEVEATNGQDVPYMGYVGVNITFPKSSLGMDIKVSTLALIVPDIRSTLSSVLIGTNSLDTLYEQYSDSGLQSFQSLPYGYKIVFKTLEMRQKVNSSLGVVRLLSKDPEVIGPGQTKVMEGSVKCRTPNSGKWVVVEQLKASCLPGGVMVTNGLASLPAKLPHRIAVILKNESDHDITIPPKSVIAEVNAIQSIQPTTTGNPDTLTRPDRKPNRDFDFGNSPIPNEWKERITEKLNLMPNVFAQHDLDFGRTDKIKHYIKLNNETPFNHKARPIHPQDIEAVRKHLQELLDAEIIRESESPFSSSIVVVRKKNGDVRLCIDYRKLNTKQSGIRMPYQIWRSLSQH